MVQGNMGVMQDPEHGRPDESAEGEPASGSTIAEVMGVLSVNAGEIAQAEAALQALKQRRSKLQVSQRILEHRLLISCITTQHLGFINTRPVAALLLHRCIRHWGALAAQDPHTHQFLKSLVADVSDQLDGIQQNMPSGQVPASNAAESESQEAITTLAALPILSQSGYWLAVLSTLLALLHRQLPAQIPVDQPSSPSLSAGGASGGMYSDDQDAPRTHTFTPPKTSKNLSTTFRSLSMGFWQRSEKPAGTQTFTRGTVGDVHAVEDQWASDVLSITPASQDFRRGLDQAVLHAYSLVRDYIKKDVAQYLPGCVQAPPPAAQQQHSDFEKEVEASRFSTPQFTIEDGEGAGVEQEAGAGDESNPDSEGLSRTLVLQQLTSAVQADHFQSPLHCWEELVAALQTGLDVLRSQHVPRILIKCLFTQLLGFINAQLFNQLLLRPECCCASNARHVLSGLKLLDQWIVAGSADAMLRPLYQKLQQVRQAATFLVAPNKSKLSVEDIIQLCPSLTNQQIYRLCTTYWDDDCTPPSSPHSPSQTTPPRAQLPMTTSAPPTPASSQLAHGSLKSGGKSVDVRGQTADGLLLIGGAKSKSQQLEGVTSVASSDVVAGEVLESLKGQGTAALHGNGGLIVTFLLEDDGTPMIAPDGYTAKEVLQLIESRDMYTHLCLPVCLDTPDCPSSVFDFVEEPPPLPAHLR